MPTLAPELSPQASARVARRRLNSFDRRANKALIGLCIVAAVVVLVTMVGVGYEVIKGAWPAISKFGANFLVNVPWVPNKQVFGAFSLIYGTVVTSVFSVLLSAVLGVAIGLFLARFAPARVAAVVGPLVEMLAAVPTVVLGLIGLEVIAPWVQGLEPTLHSIFGWIPIVGGLFGTPGTTGLSLLTASLVLTTMVLPIVAALTRDVFLTVPRELTDAAEALGSTQWEVVRGVILPTTKSGIVGACVLGFGRAVGEAIAVTQVIGGLSQVHGNLFDYGDTLASRIAEQFSSPDNAMHTSALFYCAVVLFVISIATNFAGRYIARGSHLKSSR